MDARKVLTDHLQTINALLGGGISRGLGAEGGTDPVQRRLKSQWGTQQQLVRRVLADPGDPVETLHDWRSRTEGFVDSYPEREGWSDRQGVQWNARDVLEAIDKLLEQIEAWQESDEFEEFDEEADPFDGEAFEI